MILVWLCKSNEALSPPWMVEQIPGGYKVLDANGQSLAYVYGRETKWDADIAKVLTVDEARRIASKSCQHYSASDLQDRLCRLAVVADWWVFGDGGRCHGSSARSSVYLQDAVQLGCLGVLVAGAN